MDAVEQVAEQSMVASVSDIQALPHYAEHGEVMITLFELQQ